MNKSISVHPLVAIVLSIIFLLTLGWTFKTGKDNRDANTLHEQDMNIIELQNDIISDKAGQLAERSVYFKKVIATKDAEIVDLNKLLQKTSQQETSIKQQNKIVYEKIKSDTAAASQLQYNAELLADYDKLFGTTTD